MKTIVGLDDLEGKFSVGISSDILKAAEEASDNYEGNNHFLVYVIGPNNLRLYETEGAIEVIKKEHSDSIISFSASISDELENKYVVIIIEENSI